jgi:hypothetical protein
MIAMRYGLGGAGAGRRLRNTLRPRSGPAQYIRGGATRA